MKIRKAVILLLALLLLPLPGAAGDFGSHAVGTAGSEFLNIDVDPRGIAMGTAFTAVTNDAFAMYWNPAGLSAIPRASAGAVHSEYFEGIRMQYFTYAQRITDTSVIGSAFRYQDFGDITHRNENGVATGKFRPRNYVYEFGWGQSITDLTDAERDISLGVTVKFLHSDLLAHANGIAGDLGIQAHFTEAYIPYNFAAVLQNLGTGQKFDQVRDSLPFRAKLGGAFKPKPFLLLALDAVMPVSNHPYGALGAEVLLESRQNLQLMLRGGFNSRNQFSGLEGLRGLSLGIGAKTGDFSFDYAFVPFGLLGDTHRFSIGWNLPAKHARRYRTR